MRTGLEDNRLVGTGNEERTLMIKTLLCDPGQHCPPGRTSPKGTSLRSEDPVTEVLDLSLNGSGNPVKFYTNTTWWPEMLRELVSVFPKL